jgi:nucleoside-diphosphate kinase
VSERTLVLVKPDGVARGLVGEVLGRIERKGFRLVALELRTLPREVAEEHYGEHRDKPFFGELVDFITSGPLLAAVI